MINMHMHISKLKTNFVKKKRNVGLISNDFYLTTEHLRNQFYINSGRVRSFQIYHSYCMPD